MRSILLGMDSMMYGSEHEIASDSPHGDLMRIRQNFLLREWIVKIRYIYRETNAYVDW